GKFTKSELTKEQAIARAKEEAEEKGKTFDPASVPGPITVYQIQGSGAVILSIDPVIPPARPALSPLLPPAPAPAARAVTARHSTTAGTPAPPRGPADAGAADKSPPTCAPSKNPRPW